MFQPSAATETSRATGPLFRPAPSLAQLDAAISRTEQYINQLYKPIDNQTATVAEYYSVPLRVYLTRYHRWILLGENRIAFCKVSLRGVDICPSTSAISGVVNRQSSETFVAEFRSPESSTSPQIRVDVNWNYNTAHYQIKLTNELFADQSTTALVYLYDLYIDTFSSRNVGHSAMLTLAKTDLTHLHSFRYTIRHGNQLLQNYYCYKQDLAKYERLARFLVQQGYQLDYDIYAPIWGYGTSYPDNLPYRISSGDGNEVYHDCHASHWNNTLDYLYQSKICKVGVATYVAISQSDPLTTSIQAMHILNKYGDPERSYLDGGNQQSTPIGAAIELEQKFNQSRIGIPMCNPIGCNYDIASGIRTFSFGALETRLGYGYGRQISRDYADTVARLALEVQIGDDQTLLMADGGTFYRPAQKGAFYLSWDASMRYAKSEPFGYGYLNDLLNMPDEYRGVLVSNMETTLDTYAFLVLYRCKKYDIGCAVGVPKPLIALSSGTNPVYMARAYSGTLDNMVLDVTTHMSLSRIQQGQSDLLGYITGVQVNGHQVNEPFSGSIDAHEHIQFTVAEYAGQVMLSFDGSLQSNGTLAGNYCSLDQQGQCAGEYGVWSVVPVATGASR